jgi:hypothetical protein
MAKLLSDQTVEEAARALNAQLRTYDRNGKPPGKVLRQAAAEIATAVPFAAENLPWLLEVAGPEVAAVVRAQARATTGSAVCAGVEYPASSVMLSATEAAGKAGVSDRAIRAACTRELLAASKSKVSGEWRIAPEALDHWMRRRRRAA